MIDCPSRLKAMAEFSPRSTTVTRLIAEADVFLREASEYVNKLELALHRIAGHGNITGDKAREIATEALGIQKPE